MLKPEIDPLDPLPKMVKIQHHSFYYVLTEEEFAKEWLPNVSKEIKMIGLKRGKFYSRYMKEMERKGTGKHEKN
jgi:hypothetical protein